MSSIPLARCSSMGSITAPYFAAGKTAKLEFRTAEQLNALKAEARKAR
jgi:hypothetical protein